MLLKKKRTEYFFQDKDKLRKVINSGIDNAGKRWGEFIEVVESNEGIKNARYRVKQRPASGIMAILGIGMTIIGLGSLFWKK
ncbi:MAG: hypothetical protein PHV68_08060 [Candidatus Gastranaerophilales bacterium]|nr:hypothetical protein [Candidatus Gastranaerophilales bacterium]